MVDQHRADSIGAHPYRLLGRKLSKTLAFFALENERWGSLQCWQPAH